METQNFKYNVSVCAIMKYEENHVAEWVAFHKCVGFNHFYIYDNNEDSTMQEVLRPYIEEGTVTLIPWYGELMQFPAYNDCVNKFKTESKYIAFIDADEFITPQVDRPLCDVLDELFSQNPDVGGVGINWRIFGTNGHQTKPDKLMIESYTRYGNVDDNKHIKTIVDPRKVHKFNNPHFAIYQPGYKCCSQTNQIIDGPFFYSANLYPIQINHYYFKSVEEFKFRIQRRKPDINITEAELQQIVSSKLADEASYNVLEDTSALKYLDAVKAELRSKGYSVN